MVEQKDEKSEDKQEEKKEDFESKWDAERQKVEQAEANYAKAVAENEAVVEQLTSSQEKIAELEKQIAAEKEDTQYPELDDTITDGNVIKSITQLRAELAAEKTKTAKLEEYAATHKTMEEKRQAQIYQDMLIEKIHKPLDKEFGVEYHNPARALADKLVDEGREKKPEDALDAANLMRKCYIQVSKKPDKKESVRTDSGGGGVTTPSGKKKTGTNAEIFEDLRVDRSWRDEPIKDVV